MVKNAYIEINSFTAKLIIAEVKTNAFFNIVVKRVVPIELGRDFDKDKFLKRAQMDYAIEVLKQFKKECNMYEVQKTTAIATFLESKKPKNLNSFIDEVYTRCGFKLDFYPEEDQQNALLCASLNTVESNKAVVFFIENDTIRLIQYNRRGILNKSTLPFGPLSLLYDFTLDQYSSEERFKTIKEYISSEIDQIEWITGLNDIRFVAIGKFFEDLSKKVRKYKKYPFERAHNFLLEKESADAILAQLEPMGIDSSRRIKGLDDCRLDCFILAGIIIKTVLEKANVENVTVSKNGVLEGTLLKSIIDLPVENQNLDMLEFGVNGCLMNLSEVREKHSRQVEKLAVILYRELKVVHKLPKGYLKILKVASYLHDIGYAVNYFHHSYHSYYMIVNNDVLSLTHREQLLAGFVASLHHGEELNISEWLKYSSIFEPDDAVAVQKLGVILNMAESLDASMTNVITDIHCDILGDSIIFKTESILDKSFELNQTTEIAKQFEQVFKKKPEIL